MPFYARFWICSAVLLAAVFSSAQQTVMHASGKLVVNGTPSKTTTTIFVSDNVETDTATHADLTSRGNSLTFAPNSQFVAEQNAFKLEKGGSKVATYTGMTAHLPDCWSVTPVRPDYMTLYEVVWSGSSAYVYARSEDVKLKGAGREWTLKEGHTARIRDVKLCKPAIDFWPQPNLPTMLELAGTTAFVTTIPLWANENSKNDLSPDHP